MCSEELYVCTCMCTVCGSSYLVSHLDVQVQWVCRPPVGHGEYREGDPEEPPWSILPKSSFLCYRETAPVSYSLYSEYITPIGENMGKHCFILATYV